MTASVASGQTGGANRPSSLIKDSFKMEAPNEEIPHGIYLIH